MLSCSGSLAENAELGIGNGQTSQELNDPGLEDFNVPDLDVQGDELDGMLKVGMPTHVSHRQRRASLPEWLDDTI